MTALISAAELSDLLAAGPTDLVLLDVRWLLGGPAGHPAYLDGHLPGAVYVDLPTELAAHGEPTDGRHPLPSIDALQASARRWGVRDTSTVVAYDANAGMAAARAWWLLRWAGLRDVRLLDGGVGAWADAGGPLMTDDVVPVPGDVTLTPGHLPVLELDDVTAFTEDGTLLDARAGERFRGEVEPIDPRAGHVPGAVSAPTTDHVDGRGRFLPADVLRERFAAIGVSDDKPVATYCGSGVTAAHEIVALSIAGFEAALYPGSWSQWSNHPDRPVATGE